MVSCRNDPSSNSPDSHCSAPVRKTGQPRCAASGPPGPESRTKPPDPLQERLVSTKLFTWFIYLSSLRPRAAPRLLMTVTHKFLQAAGEASPWAQAASGSASGCVPARLRRPLGRHSLTQLPPCEVNPTGSPCPVFAGGGGPPCSAAVGAGGAGASGSRRSSTITQETRAQRGQETPAPGSTLDAELGLESCFPRAP